MGRANEIFTAAFDKPRDKRSNEYKLGASDTLKFRCGEIHSVRCPYEIGTAQADAYFAGCAEGHQLFNNEAAH